jgi:hypothetical protein
VSIHTSALDKVFNLPPSKHNSSFDLVACLHWLSTTQQVVV